MMTASTTCSTRRARWSAGNSSISARKAAKGRGGGEGRYGMGVLLRSVDARPFVVSFPIPCLLFHSPSIAGLHSLGPSGTKDSRHFPEPPFLAQGENEARDGTRKAAAADHG